MEQLDFGEILRYAADIIVLISAVIIALKNIGKTTKEPIDAIKAKNELAEEKHIVEVFDKKIPEVIQKHNEEVKEQRMAETQKIVDGMKTALEHQIDENFQEVKRLVSESNVEIKDIKRQLDILTDTQKDILYTRLSEIYYRYLPYQKIKTKDKKLFNTLYQDYNAIESDTWIQDVAKTIENWTVVAEDYTFENEKIDKKSDI